MAEVTRSEALSQVRRTISAYRDRVHEVRADTDYLPPEGARIVDEYCSFGKDWQDLVQDAIREPPFLEGMDDGLLLEYCAVCKELDEALGLDSWSIGSVERIIGVADLSATPWRRSPRMFDSSAQSGQVQKSSFYKKLVLKSATRVSQNK